MFDQEVAVKLMPVPKSIHDRCVLHDIFTEILILDKWKADERICKLIDYGVDDVSVFSLFTLLSFFMFFSFHLKFLFCICRFLQNTIR
jgi:hypothetical protein